MGDYLIIKHKKTEKYYRTNKEKLQKGSGEHYGNLSEGEKNKKRNYEIKIYQTQIEKKKEYIKNYYYKRKNLLNDLINSSELIFKVTIFLNSRNIKNKWNF